MARLTSELRISATSRPEERVVGCGIARCGQMEGYLMTLGLAELVPTSADFQHVDFGLCTAWDKTILPASLLDALMWDDLCMDMRGDPHISTLHAEMTVSAMKCTS